MSDAAIATLVTGLITITTMIVGFLTMWVKFRYGHEQIEEGLAANRAETRNGNDRAEKHALRAESTATEVKATAHDTKEAVVGKLNGGIDAAIAANLAPMQVRLDRLEEYNRTSSHRLFDAINAIHLKLLAMSLPVEKPSDKPAV